MDQDRHVQWSPQTLRSSKGPESEQTPGEPSTNRVPVRSRGPAKPVSSPTPTRPNVPEEEEDQQEGTPPKNTLRSLIRQTLKSRQPQPQPHPHPPLACEELRKRWTRLTALTLALEHHAKVHAHGIAFGKEACQALRQISYVLQLVASHMERHGGGAAGGLDPESELRELREQIEKIVEAMSEVKENVVKAVGGDFEDLL